MSLVAIALLLGAALGSMGELAVYGHVTNFIPFPPDHWRRLPIYRVLTPAGLVVAAVSSV